MEDNQSHNNTISTPCHGLLLAQCSMNINYIISEVISLATDISLIQLKAMIKHPSTDRHPPTTIAKTDTPQL